MTKFAGIFVIFLLRIYFISTEIYLSNLDSKCLRCLCEGISQCNITRGCEDEYCGPFFISRIYWVESGKVVLPDDNPNRANAFSDCARDYQCSSRIITNYMIKHAKDCNGDQVVDCLDYAAIHVNGHHNCNMDLNLLSYGKIILERYNRCKQFS